MERRYFATWAAGAHLISWVASLTFGTGGPHERLCEPSGNVAAIGWGIGGDRAGFADAARGRAGDAGVGGGGGVRGLPEQARGARRFAAGGGRGWAGEGWREVGCDGGQHSRAVL